MSGSGSTQVPPPAADEVAPPLNMMPIVQENRLPTLAFYSWCQQMWASLQGTAGIIPSIKKLLDDVAIIFGMHGDGTLSETGELTVNSSQGRVFVASAFVDTTDADNITSGTLAPARIADGSLNYAKIQNVTDDTLLGRSAGTNGPMMEITIGTNLTLTGGVLNATGGGGSGTVTNIATGTGLTGGPITTTGTISLATIADQRILANISGGVAAPIPNTLSDIIDDIFGNTRGDLLFRGASAWSALAPGATARLPLVTGAAGADPAWATNVNVPGWLDVGATGVPTNTTAGDITGTRMFLGPDLFSIGSVARYGYQPTAFNSGQDWQFVVGASANANAAANNDVRLMFFRITMAGSANATNLNGLQGDAIYNGTGTLGSAVGATASVRSTAAGTVSDARALSGQVFNSGSTITAGYTLRAEAPSMSGGGTIGALSGLYIGAQKGTGVTKGYGINAVGTADFNVLAGATTVGATADPGTSCALDVVSTTGAVRFPSMTTTQRLALTPSNGMEVYDTTLDAFYKYEAGQWKPQNTITTALVYADGSVPAGNTVANTVAETAITSSYTFPAGVLSVGDVITVRLAGVYSTILTPNLTVKIKLGSATLVSTGAFATTAALSNAGWDIEATFICTVAGVGGKLECQGVGQFGTGAASGVIVPMPNTAAVAINTNIANALTVTFQWGTASASDTITCREITIWAEAATVASGGGSPLLYSNAVPVPLPGGTTVQTDLMVYTMPANTLVNVGDCLEIVAQMGMGTAGSGSRLIIVQFGSASTGLTINATNQSMTMRILVTKTGPNTQMVVFNPVVWSAAFGAAAAVMVPTSSFQRALNTSEIDTSPIVIKTAGSVATAGAAAVTSYFLSVRLLSV